MECLVPTFGVEVDNHSHFLVAESHDHGEDPRSVRFAELGPTFFAVCIWFEVDFE
jgi:hypothetical protein